MAISLTKWYATFLYLLKKFFCWSYFFNICCTVCVIIFITSGWYIKKSKCFSGLCFCILCFSGLCLIILWTFNFTCTQLNYRRYSCSIANYDIKFDNSLFAPHRGFSGTYVKEYIEASNPVFAIGEYWDSLSYEHGSLCYNQGYYYWYHLSLVYCGK